jgi:elongation factor G
MGDLSGAAPRHRHRAVGAGRTQVSAEVPETEITRYAIDLRSLSHGTATFTRTYIGHEPMPPMLVKKVLEDAAKG